MCLLFITVEVVIIVVVDVSVTFIVPAVTLKLTNFITVNLSYKLGRNIKVYLVNITFFLYLWSTFVNVIYLLYKNIENFKKKVKIESREEKTLLYLKRWWKTIFFHRMLHVCSKENTLSKKESFDGTLNFHFRLVFSVSTQLGFIKTLHEV